MQRAVCGRLCTMMDYPLFWTGISAETHLFLEHAFCEHDLHASAAPLHTMTTPLLLACLSLLLTLH